MPPPASPLDPLLAPALQLEQLPVVSGRAWADKAAEKILKELEQIALRSGSETDASSAGQLANVSEALGVCVISLVAYSRGRVPKVKSQKPDVVIADTSRRRQ